MIDYTNLIDKVNIPELVKALRSYSKESAWCASVVWEKLMLDAAAVIEALQAEVERLKDSNEELREKQTYIDRYGTEWLTSAKDVPNYAYEHGYADGMAEVKMQLPKRGKWIKDEEQSQKHIEAIYTCSACHNFDAWGVTELYPYCPNCGAKMEVQEIEHEYIDTGVNPMDIGQIKPEGEMRLYSVKIDGVEYMPDGMVYVQKYGEAEGKLEVQE